MVAIVYSRVLINHPKTIQHERRASVPEIRRVYRLFCVSARCRLGRTVYGDYRCTTQTKQHYAIGSPPNPIPNPTDTLAPIRYRHYLSLVYRHHCAADFLHNDDGLSDFATCHSPATMAHQPHRQCLLRHHHPRTIHRAHTTIYPQHYATHYSHYLHPAAHIAP